MNPFVKSFIEISQLIVPESPNPISKRDYHVRKQLLEAKYNHILDKLREYDSQLTEVFTCIKFPTMSRRVVSDSMSAIKILSLLKNTELTSGHHIVGTLYNLLVELYVVVGYLQIIEKRVDNSIEYSEIDYQSI